MERNEFIPSLPCVFCSEMCNPHSLQHLEAGYTQIEQIQGGILCYLWMNKYGEAFSVIDRRTLLSLLLFRECICEWQFVLM
jgi:hypothetical protein